MWRIEKAGGRQAVSGRERGADPAVRPFAFTIVLTDQEPGTGYNDKALQIVTDFRHCSECKWK